jgi:phospholipid/cholesterol/gamma-HCH transport system ATP-binding protein
MEMQAGAREPVLVFEDVTVRFDDAVVLDRASFRLDEGDTCVILGAAGSGKTVLLKAAIGLIRPDGGRVMLFGEPAHAKKEQELVELRSQVGVLFQEGGLFDSLTIEENVVYPLFNQRRLRCPADQARERVVEALRFVELEHTLEKVPSELSGGMRRRVGMARAIVTAPRLLLYDSPTAGLDPITANTIMALIAKERDLRQTTTLLATHRYQDGHLLANYRYNPNSGRLERSGGQSDTRFFVLREGRLVFEGSQSELEASRDDYVSRFARTLDANGAGRGAEGS